MLNVRQGMTKVALAGVVLIATACGSGPAGQAAGTGGQPSRPGLPSASSAPLISGSVPSLGETSNSLVLPLTPYYPSPEQFANLGTMRDELLSRCMERVGFSFPIIIHEPVSFGSDPGRGQFYDFGVTSLSFAARYGYHDTSVAYPIRTESGDRVPQSATLSAAETSAERDCATQVDGKTGYLNSNWNVLVQGLGVAAWQRANADPRVLAGFRRWSSCMMAKGFDYSTPLRAVVGQLGNSKAAIRWITPVASQLEIQTATADAACKQHTGLLKIWIAVLVAFQRAVLSANMPRLRANLVQFAAIYHKEQLLLAQRP